MALKVFIACLVAVVIYALLDKLVEKIRRNRKHNKFFNTKESQSPICYHTKLDCEGCLNSRVCRQIDGMGLVTPKGKVDDDAFYDT